MIRTELTHYRHSGSNGYGGSNGYSGGGSYGGSYGGGYGGGGGGGDRMSALGSGLKPQHYGTSSRRDYGGIKARC